MYYVYMLRCEGGSLYTGITTCPRRRLREHLNTARGAKYTALHRPLGFAAIWTAGGRGEASRLESKIKTLSHACKEALADGGELPWEGFTGCGRVDFTQEGEIQ